MKNKYSIFSLIKNAFSYHENWQRAWRDPEPKKEYDAVIIGGGGHGMATAYNLALEIIPPKFLMHDHIILRLHPINNLILL